MDKKEMGKIIKVGIAKKGLTNQQFAKLLEIAESTVSMWTSGKNFPPGDKLIKIAEMLSIEQELFPRLKKTNNLDKLKEEILIRVDERIRGLGNSDKLKEEILIRVDERIRAANQKIESLEEKIEKLEFSQKTLSKIEIDSSKEKGISNVLGSIRKGKVSESDEEDTSDTDVYLKNKKKKIEKLRKRKDKVES